RAFCAGADLKEIASRGAFGASFWSPRSLDLMTGLEFPKPTIAAVNGHALGLGMMLALGCDVRIAAENATFGLPQVKVGIAPGRGVALRLPRLIAIGPALEMLLTGDKIDAQQALTWNLVNRVVPQAQLLDSAAELAERIAANAPLAVRASREL